VRNDEREEKVNICQKAAHKYSDAAEQAVFFFFLGISELWKNFRPLESPWVHPREGGLLLNLPCNLSVRIHDCLWWRWPSDLANLISIKREKKLDVVIMRPSIFLTFRCTKLLCTFFILLSNGFKTTHVVIQKQSLLSHLTDGAWSLNNADFIIHALISFIGTWANLGCVSPVWDLVSIFN